MVETLKFFSQCRPFQWFSAVPPFPCHLNSSYSGFSSTPNYKVYFSVSSFNSSSSSMDFYLFFIFYFLKVLQLYIVTILYEINAWERWNYNIHEYGLEMADLRKIKWIGTFWSYSASILHASSYIIRITGTTNKGWHPPWLLME